MPRIRLSRISGWDYAVIRIWIPGAVEVEVSSAIILTETIPHIVSRVRKSALSIHQGVVPIVVSIPLVGIVEIDDRCRTGNHRGKTEAKTEHMS